MFSKIRTIGLAAAAVAALGAATLIASADSADARGFGGGFGRGGGGGMHAARIGGGANFHARMPGRVTTNFRPGRPGIHIPGRPGIKIGHRLPHLHPNWCRWHRCGIHVRWYRPWLYGGVAATTYAVAPTTVTAAPAPSCTCLTKEYTPDNLVVFKDVCTKEVASAPIGNTQVQIQVPQQQAPVQQ
jgi:hypothetical protein